MEEKIDATHYLVMYLAGFGFYSYQVYTQLLYSFYGLSLVIPFIIAFTLLPLVIYYVCKNINKKDRLNHKTNFLYTIVTIIYLAITSLVTLNYASVMVHNYYYQSTDSYIIAFFLIIPIIYMLFKSSKTYYSLAFIMFFVYLLFNFLYSINHETVDLFPLFNSLNISSPWRIIILCIPIFLEPIILLSNHTYLNSHKKINIKGIVITSILVSLLGIYTIIRQSMEFGLLIENISFPYFESGKYMSIKSNFDNIDYYYLFLITIAIFFRIPMFYFTIKDNFKLSNKILSGISIITIVAIYFIQKRLEFYRLIIIPSLLICSLLLIVLFILSFFAKRRKEDAQ